MRYSTRYGDWTLPRKKKWHCDTILWHLCIHCWRGRSHQNHPHYTILTISTCWWGKCHQNDLASVCLRQPPPKLWWSPCAYDDHRGDVDDGVAADDDHDVADDVDDDDAIVPSVFSRPDNVASGSDGGRTRVGDCVHVRSVSDGQLNKCLHFFVGIVRTKQPDKNQRLVELRRRCVISEALWPRQACDVASKAFEWSNWGGDIWPQKHFDHGKPARDSSTP